ncbi:MAG TPA: Fe-S cluster assembly protein SufD [Burkholderiales bacterium]|nr:Fe-S cluster assembly protein SufD [Burkholderiales bacterium]
MTIVATHPYVAALLAGGGSSPHSSAAWLNRRRAAALESANALSVPTTREEDWRFTDLAPLNKLRFEPLSAAAAAAAAAPVDTAAFLVPEAALRLVFVDGVYSAELSSRSMLPAGVTVSTLAEGLKANAAQLEPHLAVHAGFEKQLFTALNTAWLRDGALVYVAKNAALAEPLHLLFIATRKDAVVCPRCLIVVETGAECTVVEDYVSTTAEAYFSNAVTEIAIAPNARVRHVRAQRESLEAIHIASCAVSLAKDASYVSQSIAFGARLSRYNLDVVHQGEGAEAVIDGLALISGRQVADSHTFMDHAVANGRCTQSHKTIVGGEAHAVFNGKVLVREGAQLTRSAQQSRNLLLSSKARVDTKPQLEIFADDVKCAHGATVGQLDAEQLFYLKSRGLPDTQARNLLTFAFGAEIVHRIPVKSLVAQFERAVMAQTAHGAQTQAGA